jgi:hypothetical protein
MAIHRGQLHHHQWQKPLSQPLKDNNSNNDDHHESQDQNKSEYYPVHGNM